MVATRLAHAAANTKWDHLPEAVRAQVQDLFLDTIAVIAAGLSDPSYAPLVATMANSPGPASVPGLPLGLSLHEAVQINGGATTVLQLQDGHRMARGHPASHIVPVLLALAEESESSSHAVYAAFVAGYEVGSRIGIAMDGLHPALHDTGTWSTIAAAVAATHLLSGGDEAALQYSIETAAALAPMPYRDLPVKGATAHHLYIGLGASTALTVAQGVAAGLTPLAGTLESFFGPRAGAHFDAAKLTDGLNGADEWATFECLNAYIKVHPTCAHLHGANDAVTTLIKRHELTATAVKHVEIFTYGAALEFDNPQPANALAARFSMEATTAIALSHGALNEQTLTDKNLHSDDVQEVMTRISVRHDPALDAFYPAGRPARVTVTLENGDSLTELVVEPLGDSTNPLDKKARRDKAVRLLSYRFAPHDADRVAQAVEHYTAGESVTGLTQALRRPTSPILSQP